MLKKLAYVASSRSYWLAIAVLGILHLSIALYYQYVKDELPCILCIQVRMWVIAYIMLAVVAMYIKNNWKLNIAAHTLNTLIFIGMFERSYLLLGTERGTIIASCGFDLGLPSWFALDQWFPPMFEVVTACGYTPELLFGITMAEALFVISAAMALLSATLVIATIRNKY